MTKKHFQAVADAVRAEMVVARGVPSAEAAVVNVAQALAREFKCINPRFDKARFLAACGF